MVKVLIEFMGMRKLVDLKGQKAVNVNGIRVPLNHVNIIYPENFDITGYLQKVTQKREPEKIKKNHALDLEIEVDDYENQGNKGAIGEDNENNR